MKPVVDLSSDLLIIIISFICNKWNFASCNNTLTLNKHSESTAKAIQVPYRPQQIFQEA